MLDWRVAEAWEETVAEVTPAGPRRGRPGRRWVWLLALVGVAAVGLAMVWTLWEGPRRYQRLVADVQATADLELWAWQRGDPALFETLLDPTAPVAWQQQYVQEFRLFPQRARYVRRGTPQVRVEAVEAQADLALVTLRVQVPDFPSGPLDYTQAFPYRYLNGRWARTGPDARLWGATQRLTTPHFILVYPERDSASVQAVAAEIEGFYTRLRADLDLAAPAQEVWTIYLTLDPPLAPPREAAPRSAYLSSPSLAQLPYGLTPSRHLKLALGRWLGAALIQDEAWAHPLGGAPVWMLPLAVGEWETLRWAGGDPDLDTASIRRRQHWQSLTQTFDAVPPMLSVLDYVEAAYGHAGVPTLIRAARAGAWTWDELTPRAFNLDRDHFETDWLRYVEAEIVRLPAPAS
ncbi:MAG: hypothetical protein KIT87_14695 [Anaerolineae bacterium]|nr:hypothetical protein [Anaerolineae bacterium]